MFDFLDQYPFILPFVIFFGRIIDVSLGTLRIIFVSKGEKYIAPIIGFFEVLIWIVVISEIFSRANDVTAYLSYAAGYASGNFIGILIEQKIAFGILLCRVYTKGNGKELVSLLNRQNFGATLIHGTGSLGEIDVIETVVDRKLMKKVERIFTEFDPNVFFVVEDVRTKQRGIFPKNQTLLSRWRIGK
ncbi:MAG: hypothetical protein CVU12_03470 [Bacteroidetes bacterium HGW-Bacteroidetes-7]|jgi:uncharacterized protein YebE (UPF0316 family)|nr:MAG: hypothetical protein CVU12_03470 [Bacteroidetes bacterium HGW-Bacteroidetes-7]